MKSHSSKTERYSAKLLFQYRVVTDGKVNKRRTCEERIILLECRSAKEGLKQTKRIGRRAEHEYENSTGAKVYFEFVGILDLQHLGVECEANEVWYDITQRLTPMERSGKLIPPESTLNAIKWERDVRQGNQS